VRRRLGSAVDLTELGVRLSCEELELERTKILIRPIQRLKRFAKQHNMKVLDIDLLRRCITLSVKVRDVERAFATNLVWSDAERSSHYPFRKPRIPRPLDEIAHAVVGLDTRPLRFDKLESRAGAGGDTGLFPSRIAELYGIGAAGRGAGQCVGIIVPAGGYDLEDVEMACREMKVSVPQVDEISVGGGHNTKPNNPPTNADMEVALDMQVIAGIAPEARISLYFAQLSQPGLVAAVSEAVHGSKARPNIIVITWGQPEEAWDPQARKALDAILQDAMRLGITVLASSGDDLSTDGFTDANGLPDGVHVDYPASSPYVLACGGTQIELDDSRTKIVGEVVWNDRRMHGTGGGISAFYSVPDFQKSVALPVSLNEGKRGRGVPDVAAVAAGKYGYLIILGKTAIVDGGTSAVAPLWGALIALLNERRGAAVGLIHESLYKNRAFFNLVTAGDNKDSVLKIGYQAAPDGSWNACTGLGTPNGPSIISALTVVA